MNKAREFLELIKRSPKIDFSLDHFAIRKEQRGLGEKYIEDLLLNRPNDLIYASEESNTWRRRRFRAVYRFSKRKSVMIVLDETVEGFLKVVTFIVEDANKQSQALRNADRYAKFARRLR